MLTGWIYVNYLFHIYRSISLPGGDWTEPDFPTPDGLNDFPEKPQLKSRPYLRRLDCLGIPATYSFDGSFYAVIKVLTAVLPISTVLHVPVSLYISQ